MMDEELLSVPPRLYHFLIVNIYRRVDGSIFLIVTWLSFLYHVITYYKGEHSMQK
jgi:hypothetical protein